MLPSGRPGPMPHNAPVGGFEALTRGAQQLGQGIGNQLESAASEYDKRVEESRKKALEAEVVEGDTEWNKYRTERKYGRTASGKGEAFDAAEEAFNDEPNELPGYFNLKGDDAFKAGPETFEAIEKKRQSIADSMGDEEARELFLKRTAGDLDGDRSEIESYRGKQRQVADLATLEARKEAALEAVSANPNNLSEVDRQGAALEQPIRRLGLSDVDREARVKEWQAQLVTAQVSGQLSRGDWQSAETVLQNKGEQLPIATREKLSAAVEKHKLAGEAEGLAGRIVAVSSNERGELNQAAALRELNQLPLEQQKRVRPVLEQRMKEQEQAYAADTKRVSTSSFTLYNRMGSRFFATELADELNERNPELFNRLENDARAETERLRRHRRDTAEDRRAQAAANTIARNLFLAMPMSEQSQSDVDQFLVGRGVDEQTRTAIMVDKRRAADVVQKGQAVPLAQFVDDAVANASSFLAPASSSKEDRFAAKEAEDEFRARATDSWMKQREKNKGALPSTEETNALIADLVKPMVPRNARQASQSAGVIAGAGTQKVRVLEELDFSGAPAKPTKGARAKELKAEGLSNADIAKKLTAEGY